MLEIDTFLTQLYVFVDDFCKTHPPKRHPGPPASLCPSEVVTLALFAQCYRFRSERDFFRFAERELRSLFPRLPHRSQFNRQVRRCHDTIVEFFLHLIEQLTAEGHPYEALDTTAAPTRNWKRRGNGHLAGQADIAWSNQLGWYEGFHVLLSATPTGVITGYGFGAASSKEQALAEVFLAARAHPEAARRQGLASVGPYAGVPYVTDKGFEGVSWHQRWQHAYGAEVITPPKRSERRRRWPKPLRRWLASIRQQVETTVGSLKQWFHLGADRPHALEGFRVRLAAKVALHNFCIWLNRQLGRENLAFADLLDW